MFMLHFVLLAHLFMPTVLLGKNVRLFAANWLISRLFFEFWYFWSLSCTGSPVFINGRWVTDLDNLDYFDPDEGTPSPDEDMLPDNSSESTELLPLDILNFQTTPEPNLILGQGLFFYNANTSRIIIIRFLPWRLNSSFSPSVDSIEVHDLRVWKIVVVTAVLLVSLVGCLGTAYYFCIWRGGRIHYMPQKTYA